MSPRDPVDSSEIFDLIDAIRDEFRRSWKEGVRPDIADFLPRVPETSRFQLFNSLLHVELRYRERAGESCVAEDYSQRFPEYRRLIGEIFAKTPATSSVPPETPEFTDEQTQTVQQPSFSKLGDYDLLGELGQGGFGVVYEAKHRKTGNRVALKMLPLAGDGLSVHADHLHRFRREFRTLSEVNHPNLVGMQTLEVDGDRWFFTMDLIDGENFLQYVRPGGHLDESRLRETLRQLIKGIIALHEERILHRDLKPSNVLVSADGTVSILDFGLIAETEQASDASVSLRTQHFAGTPPYAAPEQLFGNRSPATDWYALGTMLFEALTGELPFKGTQAEVLLRKNNEDAQRLQGRKDIPADLAALVDQLLQRAPEARPDAETISITLGIDFESTSHGSQDSQDDRYVAADVEDSEGHEESLLGRESQLATLHEVKQRLFDSHLPQVVWISGLSGEGKSALARGFLRSVRRRKEMLVLAGRCYDRESVPFKAVDCIIDSLVRYLRNLGEIDAEELLPEEIPFLAHLFPVLRRVETIAAKRYSKFGNISNYDGQQIRSRGFAALSKLLRNMSWRRPLTLFIDDLQWGDADSAEVLAQLLSEGKPPALLFLGSFRRDEAAASPFLREWESRMRVASQPPACEEVEVGPLAEEESLKLIAARTGLSIKHLTTQLSRVYSDTGGNPYFLEQLIDSFDSVAGEFVAMPLNRIIASRLKKLPELAGKLLQIIAVSGQPISVREASFAAGLDHAAISIISQMRTVRLVRLFGRSDEQFVDAYHDKVRETLLADMSLTERQSVHRRVAETIEQIEKVSAETLMKYLLQGDLTEIRRVECTRRVQDLAYHFFEANDPRSFTYQLLAAGEAVSAYAHDEAKLHLDRALSHLPSQAELGIRFYIHLLRGEVSLRLVNIPRASKHFSDAVIEAPSPRLKAFALAMIGHAKFCVGELQAAQANYDAALLELGKRRPRTQLMCSVRIFEIALRVLLIPREWHRNRDHQRRWEARLEREIYARVAQFNWEINMLQMVHAAFQQCLASFREGNSQIESVSLALVGACSTLFSRSAMERFLRKSRELAMPGADLKCDCHRHFFDGVIYLDRGQTRKGMRSFRLALEVALSSGEPNFNYARLYLQRALLRGGSSSEELELAHEMRESARSMNDPRGVAWGRVGAADACARRGAFDEGCKHLRAFSLSDVSPTWKVTRMLGLASSGYLFLQASRYDRACEVLGQLKREAIQHRLFEREFVRFVSLLLEAQIGPDWFVPQRRQVYPEVGKNILVAKILHRQSPAYRGTLLRVRGRAAISVGSFAKGKGLLTRAIQELRRVDCPFDLAKGLLDLSAVDQEGGKLLRSEAITQLRDLQSVIPRAESWLLGEDFDESLVAPEFDLDAWEQEHGPIQPEESN